MAVLGIDLGTTNSLAAVWQNGRARLIPNPAGGFLTPSAVSIDGDGSVLVGRAARDRMVGAPGRSAAAFKRAMGTDQRFVLAGREYTPEELSSLVLRSLKQDAEAFLGEEVTEAVVSVPAYFNAAQRAATKRAGQLAGLRVERLINEPSAAALSCYDPAKGEAVFLVFDFGGGTLDVSVVECFENVVNILAVCGDNQLGGLDFDTAIARLFCETNNLQPDQLSRSGWASLLRQAEAAKMAMTRAGMAVMVQPEGELSGSLTLNGDLLIQRCAGLFERMAAPVRRALRDSGITPAELQAVVPVGGSCRMPVVRQYLSHMLRRPLQSPAGPDTAVALGAALYAGMKSRETALRQLVLTDICPFTLGVAVENHAQPGRLRLAPVIERNSALPSSKVHNFCTAADGQTAIRVEVYQGEQPYVEDDLCLGQLSLTVPPGPRGQESADVRFTYDINGILEVEVRVLSTGETQTALLVGQGSGLTQEEAEERMRQLAHLKLHPREQEENRALIAQGERLYAESLGAMRQQVGMALEYFAAQLESQEPARISHARRRVAEFWQRLEQRLEGDELLFGPEEPDGSDTAGEGPRGESGT